MRSVKVGDYVKIRRRGTGPDYVEKVARMTKTQVVTISPAYGNEGPTGEDRYRLASGDQISSFYSWNKPFICDDEPNAAEIAQFEQNMKSAQYNREIRSRANSFEQESASALLSLLRIPAEKFKLQWSFGKEEETVWSLELKNLTQQEVAQIIDSL